MKIPPQQHSKAFTLLEIMVALALFALVAAAIYSSWFAAMRGTKVGLTAAAKVQRSRIAMQTIEEALASARSFDANTRYYWFVGENGGDATLSFVAKLAESFPRSAKFGDFDVRRVTFSLEAGPDSSKQLVLRQQPVLMDMDRDEKLHPVVIAQKVKAFGLEFWDGKSEDLLDEWDQTNRIPKMVRVTLQFDEVNGAQAAPPIVKEICPMAMAVSAGWQRGGGGPGGPQQAGGVPPPGFQPPPSIKPR